MTVKPVHTYFNFLSETKMAKKKMTMARFEKSAADKKMDKSGKYGKEGSKREQAADRAAIAKINKKKK